MDYLDFDIELREHDSNHYAIAVRSQVGEARATTPFSFTTAELENALLKVENAILRSVGVRRKNLTPEEAAVQVFGQKLFEFLLSGESLILYRQCQQLADTQGRGVRVKLNVVPPGLAILPWEFLYDARQRDYVCLNPNTPLIRYTELPLTVPRLLVTPPLRILGVCINAVDLGGLDVVEERRRMEDAVRDLRAQGLVELTWLEGQTSDDLQRAMRRGTWHILHFIGHGSFDTLRGEGTIILADEHGKAAPLYATQLARLLQRQRGSLRLVLLNACEGARGGQQDLFSSTATTLVGGGIPAVLAMQYDITDGAALQFARTFYEALADNLPVDNAVAEARNAINLRNRHSLEWGTPVLYMRAPDGHLFHLEDEQNIVEGQTQTHIRRLESALPSFAELGATIDLVVKVALPDSPLITSSEFLAKLRSESITNAYEVMEQEFPVEGVRGKVGKGRLEIHVVTNDFDIVGADRKYLLVPPDKDSHLVRFLLRPKHLGDCRVNVDVYDGLGSYYLGSAALAATVSQQISTGFLPKLASVTVKLFVRPLNLITGNIIAEPKLNYSATHHVSTDTESALPQPRLTSQFATNSLQSPIAFDWVTIPAGEFFMGSDKAKDDDAGDNEIPQHQLYLPTYHIARVPVTNAQYKQFVDATGYEPPSYWRSGQIPSGKKDYPVVYVSWQDAIAFCQWAGVRLPTEAEWEKAARGTDGRIWPWGNELPDKERCNFNGNGGNTTPVGTYFKGASPYGVLDMAGNVWEWTSSLWGQNREDPDFVYPYDPNDGREDPAATVHRVLRGGSFSAFCRYGRCASRLYGNYPVARSSLVGFRVVRQETAKDN